MTGSFKGIRVFGNLCLWRALSLILTEDVFLPSLLCLHSSRLPFLFPPASLPASKPSVHCARHCAKGGSKNCHLYIYDVSQVHPGVWHCVKTLGPGDPAEKTRLAPAPVGWPSSVSHSTSWMSGRVEGLH